MQPIQPMMQQAVIMQPQIGQPIPMAVVQPQQAIFSSVQLQPAIGGLVIGQQPMVIGQQTQSGILSCNDVYMQCKPPKFDTCHFLCALCTAIGSGSGLEWCCCYGCDKADCMNVCLAGFCMEFTATYVMGYIIGCIVGFNMFSVQ